MSVRNRLVAVASAAAIAPAAVAAVDVVSGARADAQSQCQLFAAQPRFEGTAVVGSGGREGCRTTSRRVTVLLREDKPWWPDSTLDSEEEYGRAVSLVVAKVCAGSNVSRTVYVETRTNTGGKAQSPRATYLCN